VAAGDVARAFGYGDDQGTIFLRNGFRFILLRWGSGDYRPTGIIWRDFADFDCGVIQ